MMDPNPKKTARVVQLQGDGDGQRSGGGMRGTTAQDRPLDDGLRRRRSRRHLLLGAAVGVALVAALVPVASRWLRAEHTVSRQRLRFGEVTRGPFVRDVRVQGQVVAAVSPTLYSPAEGDVTLFVRAGDEVEAGQTLALVASPELTSLLASEHSALEAAEVDLARQRIEAKQRALENQQAKDLAQLRLRAAERELRRAEDSHGAQVISAHDYEEAVDELESARVASRHANDDAGLDAERLAFESRAKQLELDRQRLRVEELERQVEELTIRSPVAGLVGNLAVEQRQAVASNQAVVTVVDLSALEVEINVPESYSDDLAPGMAVEINLGGASFPGSLAAISPEIVGGQVSGRVGFGAQQPPGLKRHQRVTARVVLDAREDVLQVRRGRFFESGGGRLVYVVNGDLLERKSVETGAASIDAVEIVEGLQPGETIVVSDTDSFEGAEMVLLVN